MHWDYFRQAINTLGWLIFAYLLVLPVIKQRMLKHGRQVLFQQLEAARKSRVIALIHRREVVNFLGFPVVQYLDIQDAEAVLRAVRLTPAEMPIDVIVHTPAGLSLSAEQIARALSRHKSKVTVFIPHYAMSGGTLMVIAADEIVMCGDAIMGALDPTIGQFPAASIVTVGDRKTAEQMNDNTFILVDQARKAIRQMQKLVVVLLSRRVDEQRAAEISRVLTAGRWTQDYPITVEEAREIGLSVSTDMPKEILQLMSLFPQEQQKRPSVDFIPAPYAPLPQPVESPQK